MDVIWYGQSCFKLKGKTATVVIDPFSAETGLKLPKDLSADLALSTHDHPDHNNLSAVENAKLSITGPGEYELAGVSVVGISSFHDDKQGIERGKNTIYHLLMEGVNLVHLGDLGHELSEDEVSEIGTVDILMIPVGGVYTINADLAAKVVSRLEPRIIIPMHYKLPELKYELDGVGGFLKLMGTDSSVTPLAKLSVTKDKLPEETTVVVLSKV